MRISDWSSDVCSSDLRNPVDQRQIVADPLAETEPRIDDDLCGIDPRRHARGDALGEHVMDVEQNMRVSAALMRVALRRRRVHQHHRAARLHDHIHRARSEEHTSELQSLMRNSYAVFCLKKKNKPINST